MIPPMVLATATPMTSGPMKLKTAERRDGDLGLERPGVDDGGDGVAAVVKTVEKVEEERYRHDRDECSA